MLSESLPEELNPITLCAILRWFDRQRLHEMTGADHAQLLERWVQTTTARASSSATPTRLQLDERARAAALQRLRAEAPRQEATLHQLAFDYFLARMGQAPPETRDFEDEDECLFHLDALFLLVGITMEWEKLASLAQAARRVGLTQLRHIQRIAMIEGYCDVRMQRYEQGEAQLTALLAQADLESDVRMKALHGHAQSFWYRSLYSESLDVYKRLSSYALEVGDQTYEGLAHLNIAANYHELGQHDLALSHCERSLALFQAAGDRIRQGHSLFHIALYSAYLGRWAAAEERAADAAQHFASLGLNNYLGFVYWLQGYIQQIFGNDADAEASYLRAMPLAESPDQGQPSLAMDVWLYLGLLHHTRGDYSAALTHYDRALEYAARLDRRHQIALIRFRIGRAHDAAGRPDDALAAFRAAIDAIEALSADTAREDVKISLLGTTQQIYEAIVLLLYERGERAETLHFVERARSRAFLDALAQKSPELLDALQQPVATLADIQARLPEDALLLEYYTTGVLPRGEHLINLIPATNTRLRDQLAQPPRILLFAISRTTATAELLRLDPNRLRPQVGERYPGRHLLHGRLPDVLYEHLLGPVADQIARCTTLYLIPHGPLHYVPFSALRASDREPLLRADGPALAQAPSATILLQRCLGRPPSQASETLALGYNDTAGAEPLLFAEAEARHIAALLGGSAWVGPDAKGERLIESGPRLRRLHIAGHARFDPADPLGSALELGQDDRLSAREMIARLELGAELVTLSSCHSGVTHVVPGDELLGIQRALLHAGAPTVICTRWEANDLVALLVMDQLYHGLESGSPPAAALRDAQIAVRELTIADLIATFERLSQRYADPTTFRVEALFNATSRSSEPFGRDLAALSQHLDPAAQAERPFADPLLWGPFMLIGRA
jgi:CHAT domain-containing protein/tetratricopeptide (TPR) repeat protein